MTTTKTIGATKFAPGKLMLAAIATAVIGLTAFLGSPASAQTLRSASITFHTNDDDKDQDTGVQADLTGSGYEVASLTLGSNTRFPDQSDNGPFSMDIHGNPAPSTVDHGKLHVHISPNGHDRWKFNATVTLEFTDGTRRTFGGTGFDLDQDSPDQEVSW